MAKKKCSKCGEIKPLDRAHFYRDSRYKDGYIGVCIDCRKAYDAEHKERYNGDDEKLESHRARQRAYYRKRKRAEAIEEIQGILEEILPDMLRDMGIQGSKQIRLEDLIESAPEKKPRKKRRKKAPSSELASWAGLSWEEKIEQWKFLFRGDLSQDDRLALCSKIPKDEQKQRTMDYDIILHELKERGEA